MDEGRFEAMSLAFHERVRASFLAAGSGKRPSSHAVVIDAELPLVDVASERRLKRCLTWLRGHGVGPAKPLDLGFYIRLEGAAFAWRFLRPDRRIHFRLLLEFGVQLSAHQHDDGGNPDPGHEADYGAKRAIGLVVIGEIGDVE